MLKSNLRDPDPGFACVCQKQTPTPLSIGYMIFSDKPL